jgi:hypothetical protein
MTGRAIATARGRSTGRLPSVRQPRNYWMTCPPPFGAMAASVGATPVESK